MFYSFKLFRKKAYLGLFFIILSSLFLCSPLRAIIIVSDLSAFELGRWTSGSGDIVAAQNLCVALRPRGPYTITISGDNQNGEFVLRSGVDTIEYQFYFNDRPRVNGRTQVFPGVALTGQRGRRIRSRNNPCRRPTANLSIIIPQANLQAASGGLYSSNLVLLVSPE